MKLSPNFALAEFVKSQTAERLGIDNTPPQEAINNLARICGTILERVREHYGKPVVISSGYRCSALNKAIGSKDNSQHTQGEAVDFEVPGVDNYELACWLRDNLPHDQIILEFYQPGIPDSGWVHVSRREAGNRGNCLTVNRAGTQIGLIA